MVCLVNVFICSWCFCNKFMVCHIRFDNFYVVVNYVTQLLFLSGFETSYEWEEHSTLWWRGDHSIHRWSLFAHTYIKQILWVTFSKIIHLGGVSNAQGSSFCEGPFKLFLYVILTLPYKESIFTITHDLLVTNEQSSIAASHALLKRKQNERKRKSRRIFKIVIYQVFCSCPMRNLTFTFYWFMFWCLWTCLMCVCMYI